MLSDRPLYYRRDGTAYPPGDAGVFMWGTDFENYDLRRVEESFTIWRDRVSTVWMGLDHRFGEGPPLIFETMVFSRGDRGGDLQWRYSTEEEAKRGHRRAFWRATLVPPFLRRFVPRLFE